MVCTKCKLQHSLLYDNRHLSVQKQAYKIILLLGRGIGPTNYDQEILVVRAVAERTTKNKKTAELFWRLCCAKRFWL